MNKWTKDENQVLSLYYGNISPSKCQKLLPSRSITAINHQARKLKLPTYFKSKRLKNINLLNFNLPESCYLLGYLWADGHIGKNYLGYKNINVVTTEPENLEEILYKISPNWNKNEYHHKNKPSWKTMVTFTLNDIFVSKELANLGYAPNDKSSCELILSKIPDDLKHFWLLGLIDGDGCFYYNSKYSLRQFQITSNIDQDWSPIQKLLTFLGIEWSIDRRTTAKEGKKRSNIRVFGRKNLQILGDYLYSSILKDQIGMKRKYDKLQECLAAKDIKS